jgi:hypothetical protein
MVDWMTWERATLYFSLAWTAYFGIKALWEVYRHNTGHFRGCHNEVGDDKNRHRNNHIMYLLAAFGVAVMLIFGYLWFDIKDTGLGGDDRAIGIFLILFINLYLAFTINHFKSERLGVSETGDWIEILKF